MVKVSYVRPLIDYREFLSTLFYLVRKFALLSVFKVAFG